MLEDLGIHPDRAAIEWVSGAEGPRFAEKVTQFTRKITDLGPNDFARKRKKEAAPCQ